MAHAEELLSTHTDRQDVDISFTVCLFVCVSVFVCLFVRLQIADSSQSPPLTERSPSVKGTGVCRQYLPLSCADIPSSAKTDVLVND